MLKQSFIFLEQISKKKERSIWKQGVKDWDDFIRKDDIKGISKRSKHHYNCQLLRASQALKDLDPTFFADNLPSGDTWRLYEDFKEHAVFLDIETTGTTAKDSLIMVGLFDGFETRTMIKGINFDIRFLAEHLSKYRLVITYNGSCFDLPFLEKRYPGILPKIPHIDLRHLCQKIGLKGGLKEIEKKFSIQRNPLIQKLYGGDVYRLWRMALASGDRHYLDLLIEYNEDDVINLRQITDFAVKEMKKDIGFNPYGKHDFLTLLSILSYPS